MLYGELKSAYPTYNRLDPEMKKAASEKSRIFKSEQESRKK